MPSPKEPSRSTTFDPPNDGSASRGARRPGSGSLPGEVQTSNGTDMIAYQLERCGPTLLQGVSNDSHPYPEWSRAQNARPGNLAPKQHPIKSAPSSAQLPALGGCNLTLRPHSGPGSRGSRSRGNLSPLSSTRVLEGATSLTSSTRVLSHHPRLGRGGNPSLSLSLPTRCSPPLPEWTFTLRSRSPSPSPFSGKEGKSAA